MTFQKLFILKPDTYFDRLLLLGLLLLLILSSKDMFLRNIRGKAFSGISLHILHDKTEVGNIYILEFSAYTSPVIVYNA